MFDLIFRQYQKNKQESYKKIWERISRFPHYIIFSFFALIISAVLGLILSLQKIENPWLYWIPIGFEILFTIVLGFTSEKYLIDNSQSDIKNCIIKCETLYNKFLVKFINSEEQLYTLLDKVKEKIENLQIQIDKKDAKLKCTNQILIIPITLIAIKALFDNTTNIFDFISLFIMTIIFYFLIYGIFVFVIAIGNYNMIKQKKMLRCFADDLQDIIDVTIIYKLSNNIIFPASEPEKTTVSISNQTNIDKSK